MSAIKKNMTGFSTLSYFAFDAVQVLARAVDDYLANCDEDSYDWSYCTMESEPKQTQCFIRQMIQNVSIDGVTVSPWFPWQYMLIVNEICDKSQVSCDTYREMHMCSLIVIHF